MANIEFEDFGLKVRDTMNQLLRIALDEVGVEIESRAARNTTVSSGETKTQWYHEVKQNAEEASVTIGNPFPNAIWEEFGKKTSAELKLGKNGER